MAEEVIDISPLIEGDNGDRTKEVDDKISKACKEIGVFYITGHGLDINFMEKILNLARKLFDLPYEKKMKIDLKNSPTFRGYIEQGTEYTANKIDVKEGFYLGQEGSQYPDEEDVPGFREITATYMDHVGKIGMSDYLALTLGTLRNEDGNADDVVKEQWDVVMNSIGRGLRLPQDFLTSQFFNPPKYTLGLWHYPPYPGCTDEGPWGIGPHTDYGVLTLLLQDDVEGLQFQMKNGEWINIKPIPGTFVVNIGDAVEAWTHRAYRATLHRVKNSPTKHRYSAPFFYEPNSKSIIRPLDIPDDIIAGVTGGPPKLIEKFPLKYGDYVGEKLHKSHGDTNKTENK